MRKAENTKLRAANHARRKRLSKHAPRHIRLGLWLHQYKKSVRFGSLLFAVLFGVSLFINIANIFIESGSYALSGKAQTLVGAPNSQLAGSLKLNPELGTYEYNQDYQPGGEIAAQGINPKFSASFSLSPEKGTTVTDPVTKTSVTFKPKFTMREPKQDQNRLIYPLATKNAVKVVSLRSIGFKEDIILNKFQGNELSFAYELQLPDGTEARMESNGSLAIYGADYNLLGDVSVGSESDQELLDAARKNAVKRNLLFTFPAPYIKEHGKKIINKNAWFTLEGKELTIHANKLDKASYPLTIDPSVYVETAAKLMKGNNETNIDFDIDNELIQKSQTTGARIDEWTGTLSLNENRWNGGVVAAGGYIYSVGGVRSNTSVVAYSTAGSDSFVVPTGVTSITVKMWGGGGGGGAGGSNGAGGNGGGAGFVQATISVTPGETLNLNIGGGGGNGNFSTGTGGSLGGDGGGGGGHSEVDRSGTALLIAAGGGGGGGGDNSSTTPGGSGGAGGGATGTAGGFSDNAPGGGGGTTSGGGGGGNGSGQDGGSGSAEQGGGGGDGGDPGCGTGGMSNGGTASGGNGGIGDDCGNGFGAGGGGGSGRFGGGGGSAALSGQDGGGGGGGGSNLTSGSSITNTAGSGVSPGNASDVSRSGAGEGGGGGSTSSAGASGTSGKIVISYSTGIGSANEARPEVYWAHFNTDNSDIQSPNPGDGACTDWCTDSAYNLPDERAGHSLVSYNGFLYAIGGVDGAGTRSNDIYVAKIGANGEPSLWHPTDKNPDNWSYWFQDASMDLSSERSYTGAVAYNNRMYILGGQTNAAPGGVTTVEMADILPNGKLGSWTTTGMQVLPAGAGRHMHSVQVYNDTLYAIGGLEGATTSSANLRNTVRYSKLNTDGTMNSWQTTNSFTTARASYGGTFTAIFGAYIYMGGGCTAVNASGYCTNIANADMQLASINADGSVGEWSAAGDLSNNRIGYSLLSWQGSLYRVGGCTEQDSGTGDCLGTLATADYGVINPAGEVSTVNISSPSGSGTCAGGSPHTCDLPPPGDSAGQGGQMLSMSTILNGYLYVIGGCTNFSCSQSTGNVSYVSIGSDGTLQAPTGCGGTSYGSWCVDSTNRVNGTSGISAAGVTTFNNRIYLVGGIDETSSGTTRIYYNSTNTDGSLSGSWSSTTLSTAGISGELAYTFAYARANPGSAGSNPGNLYVMGGCSAISASAGCSSAYNTEVYKCNITTTGNVSGCSTSGQLQLDTELATETNQGLGLHSGTVYANYIYLIGGYSDNVGDRDTVFYAKFDNSNNIVDAVSGTANPASNDDDWMETDNTLNTGRRRGWAFGYNGHIYAVGGYDDTGSGQVIPFIEWSRMNVSNGAIDPFEVSNVTINQRWGLSMVVSNGYAYVIGGCDVGASPSDCGSFERAIQTFQLYNNDSGAINNFTSQADDTFTTATNRIGASSAVLNGYLYVAGGCTTNTSDTCTAATNSVQYAPLSAADGSVGTWAAGGNLPANRTWGSLEAAGGSLYYIGGQDNTATNEQSTVYYTTAISSGNPTWGTATNGLPGARTRLNSTVWNNRIYVVGGLDGSAAVTNTVYVSPQLNSGGNITSAWSSSNAFSVARTGAAVTAYANNLYIFGGFDGSNYLSDVQFAKIDGSTGGVGGWTYTTSMPGALRDATAVSANGYIYLINGRSAATTCAPKTLITPVSANTVINPDDPPNSNNPTGIGEWYETNVKYTGDRYGAAVTYDNGKIYTMGGGCTAPLSSNRNYYSTVKSQPQVAKYSRMIDTDTDVFPNSWLMNGVDNSIGARWQMRYRSMNDTDGLATDCGTSDMTTWGQETNHGDVTLGTVGAYTPKDGSGNNINCARYYYFFISIDASKTFGYPEDVNRGPTINDLSLFFVSDPSKRLRHGKTFTGGEQQPLDTPCRRGSSVSGDPNYHCPLP